MVERPRRERREDERFCSECGEPVKRAAVVCVHCGVPLKPLAGTASARAGTGLEPHVAAALSYLLTWLTGLIVLLVEREDEYVRFHARQAIAFGIASVIAWCFVAIFSAVSGGVFFVGEVLPSLAWAAFYITWVVLWIVLMVKAYQGERFKLWVLGNIAEGQGASATS